MEPIQQTQRLSVNENRVFPDLSFPFQDNWVCSYLVIHFHRTSGDCLFGDIVNIDLGAVEVDAAASSALSIEQNWISSS